MRKILLLLIVAFCCRAWPDQQRGQRPDTKPVTFPLGPGTYWVYRGQIIHWAPGGKSVTSPVTWKMEITSVIRGGDQSAVVVHGFPTDMNWSDGNASPMNSVIAVHGGRLYLFSRVEYDRFVAEAGKPNADLADLLADQDQILQFPLVVGERYGADPKAIKREDGMYMWSVDSSVRKSFANVKGVAPGLHTVFHLQYLTMPDSTRLEYVPGVGITRYQYDHHGTTADTDVRLVEFHAGTAQ